MNTNVPPPEDSFPGADDKAMMSDRQTDHAAAQDDAAAVAQELSGYLDDVDQVVREHLTDEVLDARLAQIFQDSEPTEPGGDSRAPDPRSSSWAGLPSGQAGTTLPARPGSRPAGFRPDGRIGTLMDIDDSWLSLTATCAALGETRDRPLERLRDAQQTAQSLLWLAQQRAEHQRDAALSIAARTVGDARHEAEQIRTSAQEEAVRIVDQARSDADRIRSDTANEPAGPWPDGAAITARELWGGATGRTVSGPETHDARTQAVRLLRESQERPVRLAIVRSGLGGGKTESFLLSAVDLLRSHALAETWRNWHRGDEGQDAQVSGGEKDRTGRPDTAGRHGPGRWNVALQTAPTTWGKSALRAGPPVAVPACADSGESRQQQAGPGFWAFLTAGEQADFTAAAQPSTFPPGTVLVGEGQPDGQFILIRSGSVRVEASRAAGEARNADLAMPGAGDMVGELTGLVSERSGTVIALTEVEALCISAAGLTAFCDRHPRVRPLLERLVESRAAPEPRRDVSRTAAAASAASGKAPRWAERHRFACTLFVDVAGFSGAARTDRAHQRLLSPPRGHPWPACAFEALPASAFSAWSHQSFGMPQRCIANAEPPPDACTWGTIVAVDPAPVAGTGGAMGGLQHAALYAWLLEASAGARLPWDRCHREDRGDGILLVVPSDVPVEAVIERFARNVAGSLRRHNESMVRRERPRLRLRVTMHAGHVGWDEHGGVTGPPLTHLARLAEASTFKEAFEEAGTDLGVILSDQAFGQAIGQGGLTDPGTYTPVKITLPPEPPFLGHRPDSARAPGAGVRNGEGSGSKQKEDITTRAWTWFPPPPGRRSSEMANA